MQTLTPKHKVTMSAGANGSISAEPALPEDGMVNKDTTIVFTAASNEGYTVDDYGRTAPCRRTCGKQYGDGKNNRAGNGCREL